MPLICTCRTSQTLKPRPAAASARYRRRHRPPVQRILPCGWTSSPRGSSRRWPTRSRWPWAATTTSSNRCTCSPPCSTRVAAARARCCRRPASTCRCCASGWARRWIRYPRCPVRKATCRSATISTACSTRPTNWPSNMAMPLSPASGLCWPRPTMPARWAWPCVLLAVTRKRSRSPSTSCAAAKPCNRKMPKSSARRWKNTPST